MRDEIWIRSGRIAAIVGIIAAWVGAIWGVVYFLKIYSQVSSLSSGMGGSGMGMGMGMGGMVMLQVLFALAMAAVIHGLMAAALCVINKHSQES